MRTISIAFGLILTNLVYGQQLSFNEQSVDSIEITTSNGYYHFDKKVTSTSTDDYYIITFDKLTGNYIAEHKRILSRWTGKPESTSENVKKFSKEVKVERQTLSGLLNSLSTTYLKPSFENIAISKEDFFLLTNKKHVLNVAKAYNDEWQFKKRYSEKEDNEVIFIGCQNIDTFNLFLSSQFDTSSGYHIVSDYWDEIHVYIKAGQNHYHYKSMYPDDFKQPWNDWSDTSTYLIPPWDSTLAFQSLRVRKITSILNFDINRHLVSILPKNFNRRKTIELESLMFYYIKWYLKRSDIIASYE